MAVFVFVTFGVIVLWLFLGALTVYLIQKYLSKSTDEINALDALQFVALGGFTFLAFLFEYWKVVVKPKLEKTIIVKKQ